MEESARDRIYRNYNKARYSPEELERAEELKERDREAQERAPERIAAANRADREASYNTFAESERKRKEVIQKIEDARKPPPPPPAWDEEGLADEIVLHRWEKLHGVTDDERERINDPGFYDRPEILEAKRDGDVRKILRAATPHLEADRKAKEASRNREYIQAEQKRREAARDRA